MPRQKAISHIKAKSYVESVVGDQLHAKRVLSLTNATVGVIHASALGVSAIGRGLALAEGLITKHAIKQVDRLLGNNGVDVWNLFSNWVPYVVGSRTEIVVALDWTDFDADNQTTIALNLITSHGRATPLLWKTVVKSELKNSRNDHEDELIYHLSEVLPADVKVTLLADRGFGDTALYSFLQKLTFNYVIRFRSNIAVSNEKGEARTAQDWLPKSGRAIMLRNAKVTAQEVGVPAVVCVKARGMKDAWHLATSHSDYSASTIVSLYGKRFKIEENFRDTKNLRFGMGLTNARTKSVQRRDRLLLLAALATVLITLLGAAGEAIGLDRGLKANTVKTRTHSLFFQGTHYYAAIPMMRQSDFERLMAEFGQIMRNQPTIQEIFGLI